MLIFRFAMMFLLLGVVVTMVFYVATGDAKYRRMGFMLIKWGVLAALGFFGVLVLERLV